MIRRTSLPVDRPDALSFPGYAGKRLGIRTGPSGRVEVVSSGPHVGFKSPEQVLEFATALAAAADEWASLPFYPTQNG